MTKLKKENSDKTQNSNCDNAQKLKLRQNLKTQIVTKLSKQNCDKTKKNSNNDKTKQNQTVTKLKKHCKNCEKLP